MKKIILFVLFSWSIGFAGAQSTVVIFYDNFITGTIMNGALWHIPTWTSSTDGTFLGRTQLRCTQSASLPSVAASQASINLDTYNPGGGFCFYGTDAISNRTFLPGKGLIFTFRVKMQTPMPGGIVGAMYLYNITTLPNHDEIDYELVTNQLNMVHTNIYKNEPLGAGHPDSAFIPSPMTDYHTYQIKWLQDTVFWLVDGQLIKTNTTFVPTGPMYLNLEMWVPAQEWASAYNALLQPVSSLSANQTYSLLIDSVRVDSLVTSSPSAIAELGNVRCTIFPNPTTDNVSLEGDMLVGNLLVVSDVLGHVVSQQTITHFTTRIDLGSLPSGLYLIQIPNKGIVKKVMKK